MALDLITLPCLKDNYAFLVHNPDTHETALVDVPEAAPILAELARRDWTLTDILLTHHHWDHIDGLPDLLAGLATPPRIWGAAADAHRLPPLDHAVAEGDQPVICGEALEILDMPGHTVGHIAFHFPLSHFLFSGDSLMVMGCGRLFEGTPGQMWGALQKTAALPGDTQLCSGHEYTAANIRFALSLEPSNPQLILEQHRVGQVLAKGNFTVPSTLAQERELNPFLRAHSPDMKALLAMPDAPDAEVFAEIRARKDNF